VPEGPEIRRAADQLARALVGETAVVVEFTQPAMTRHGERLSGQRIVAVEPRSKAMLIHFADGQTVYSHNQLYGRWYVVTAGKSPRTARALRLAIHTARRSALLYSASDIQVMTRAELASHPYLARLGMELLAATTTRDAVRTQVERAQFQGRRLAALLLDQGFLAGLGNYLRSEILYVTGLHHEQKLGAVGADGRRRLADAAFDLTRQAYRTRGVTNDVQRAAELKAQGLSFATYRHHVFAREGAGCWTCETPVERVDVAGRAIFYCPVCQGASRFGSGRGIDAGRQAD
jgi:endonuclease-8